MHPMPISSKTVAHFNEPHSSAYSHTKKKPESKISRKDSIGIITAALILGSMSGTDSWASERKGESTAGYDESTESEVSKVVLRHGYYGNFQEHY